MSRIPLTNKLTAVATGVLVVSVIGMLAYSDRHITGHTESYYQQAPAPFGIDKQPTKPLIQSSIELGTLFGIKKDDQVIQAPRELPQTRLELVLKGTFTHDNEQKASALIALPGKPEKRYKIGEGLPGGAKLITVNRGEIVLRRNDRDELLTLPILQAKENHGHPSLGTTTAYEVVATPLTQSNRPTTEGRKPDAALQDRLSALRESSKSK